MSTKQSFNIHNIEIPYPEFTPVDGQKYTLYVWYLARETTPQFYGVVNFIGGFPTKQAMQKKVDELTEEYAKYDLRPVFRYSKGGKWVVLTPQVDSSQELEQQGKSFIKKKELQDKEKLEKEQQRLEEQSILQDKVEEQYKDKDSLIYYAKHKLMKTEAERAIKVIQQQIDTYERNKNSYVSSLNKLTSLLEEMDQKHPDYVSRWETEARPLLD